MSRTLPLRVARAGLPGIDMPDAAREDLGLPSHDRGTARFVERQRPLAAGLIRGTAPS